MEIKDYLLFDGAYGTYYCSKDPDRIPSCELANLYDREGILKIHRQYIKSGCMALKTNTYGANTYRLDCTEEELHKIITKGYEIAMEASEGNIPVFADIGPVINEDGQADYEQTQKIVDWFLALGATNFLFETNFDDTVFQTLVPYIRKKASAFIILSFAIDAMGYTKKGIYYQDIIRNVETLADAYGFNCLSGPAHLLEFVSQVDTEGKVLSVMPNAGYPVVVGGRMIYNDNPEYFADKVYQIYQHGVKIIGGCCGTTPEHIRQLALKLKSPKGGKQAAVQQIPSNQQQNLVANRFREKLERGQKVIACELHAPMEPDFRDTLEKSAALKERGVDLITIADSPMARARADSFLSAAKIKREAGIDAMPHLCCRDRNDIAIRGALIGGYIENLRNILVITGDPVVHDAKGANKGVFNFNSYQLIHYISSLNERLFNRQPITIGCGTNPNAVRFDVELSRCKTKREKGAYFVMTQPTYTQQGLDNIIALKQTGLKVLAGIMPIASYKNALFLNNEVPGIEIPEQLVARYQDTTREEAEQISEEVSAEMMDKLAPFVDGFYFMCPLNRIEVVAKLAERMKQNDFNR